MESHQRRNELKVFVDSSVFFAASFSITGPAHALILEASRGACILQISELVIEETRRNLGRHAPAAVPVLERLLQMPCVKQVKDPTTGQVPRVARLVNLKDAPIIAAAMRAKSDFMATHDKELLRQATEVAEAYGVAIVSPADILPTLRMA